MRGNRAREDVAGQKVVRFSVNVGKGRRSESRDEDGQEEELLEMMRFVELCPECQEKVRDGASVEELEHECSELRYKEVS